MITDIKPDADEEFKKFEGSLFLYTSKKIGAQTAEANTNAGYCSKQINAFLQPVKKVPGKQITYLVRRIEVLIFIIDCASQSFL